MLYAVIKIPRLCDEFHKARRRKFLSEKLNKTEKEDCAFMKGKFKEFPSETAFLDNFVV